MEVVVATTKVHIFKQITTDKQGSIYLRELLLLPQRYIFSSKSQQRAYETCRACSCCCYHKGTYFQANHNLNAGVNLERVVVVATTKVHIFKQITTCARVYIMRVRVVVATTKVHIFKQITTLILMCAYHNSLLLLPQRYIFSSKSQLDSVIL